MPERDDADVLDAVIGEQPLQVVLRQGEEHAAAPPRPPRCRRAAQPHHGGGGPRKVSMRSSP